MKDSRHGTSITPQKPSIQYSCNYTTCPYKTNRYHNPLKAKVMLLNHLVETHLGVKIDFNILKCGRPLVKSVK